MTNIEIIKNAYNAFGRGDIPSVLDVLDRDIDWNPPSPIGTHVKGKSAVEGYLRNLRDRHFQEIRMETEKFVSETDTVCVLGRRRGIARDTGKPFEVPFCQVWSFRNGKVVSLTDYSDTLALSQVVTRAKVNA